MAPRLRRSRLHALAARGTGAGAPARRDRTCARRGHPSDQPVCRAGPGRDRRPGRTSTPRRRVCPLGGVGRAQRRVRTASGASGWPARRRGAAGRRRHHRCLRGRGTGRDSGGMRCLRQHYRRRHPSHGGGSTRPVCPRSTGSLDQTLPSARPDSGDPVLVRGGGLPRRGLRHQSRRLHVGRRAPADGRAHLVGAWPATIHVPGRIRADIRRNTAFPARGPTAGRDGRT
jgi:hypothetical protein